MFSLEKNEVDMILDMILVFKCINGAIQKIFYFQQNDFTQTRNNDYSLLPLKFYLNIRKTSCW